MLNQIAFTFLEVNLLENMKCMAVFPSVKEPSAKFMFSLILPVACDLNYSVDAHCWHLTSL